MAFRYEITVAKIGDRFAYTVDSFEGRQEYRSTSAPVGGFTTRSAAAAAARRWRVPAGREGLVSVYVREHT